MAGAGTGPGHEINPVQSARAALRSWAGSVSNHCIAQQGSKVDFKGSKERQGTAHRLLPPKSLMPGTVLRLGRISSTAFKCRDAQLVVVSAITLGYKIDAGRRSVGVVPACQ